MPNIDKVAGLEFYAAMLAMAGQSQASVPLRSRSHFLRSTLNREERKERRKKNRQQRNARARNRR